MFHFQHRLPRISLSWPSRAGGGLRGLIASDMGIDLGTSNTHVCVQGRGVVLSEPSVVAVRKGTTEVLCQGTAVGRMAQEMLGRTPLSIDAVRPLRDGVVSDFDLTEALIAHCLRAAEPRRLLRPRLLLTVPVGISAIEKRALVNAADRAGARRVYLLEEPRAAGLGAGLPIHLPAAHMIVDVGGGSTDIAILSLADIVESTSIKVGGDAMDAAIVQHIHRFTNNLIGARTAEALKVELASLLEEGLDEARTVSGRDLIAGRPRAVTISRADLREALLEPAGEIIEAVRGVLERAGPEVSGDLVENGILLCGGGALLRGLPELIEEEFGLPVRVAADPGLAVARGAAILLERLELCKDILESGDNEL